VCRNSSVIVGVSLIDLTSSDFWVVMALRVHFALKRRFSYTETHLRLVDLWWICDSIASMSVSLKSMIRRFAAFRNPRSLFMPSVDKCLAMLQELEAFCGSERLTADVLGVPVLTMRAWKKRRKMSIPARRVVWLITTLMLHRERIETGLDLLTWGWFSEPIVPSPPKAQNLPLRMMLPLECEFDPELLKGFTG
jgi:hypothetical protein